MLFNFHTNYCQSLYYCPSPQFLAICLIFLHFYQFLADFSNLLKDRELGSFSMNNIFVAIMKRVNKI